MMTRLHTQIGSVPGRALDALDVTRARRNGRRARRNCGCGPGCGCAPCMEKYGTQANPKRPRDSHADWVRGGGTRGDDETLWVVRVLDWNGQENDYINAYGKKAAAAHMRDAKRAGYEKVWKVPAKMTDAGIVALDKLPRTNGARKNHHLKVGDEVRSTLRSMHRGVVTQVLPADEYIVQWSHASRPEPQHGDYLRRVGAPRPNGARQNHHIRPGGTFYTPGGRRGTTRGPAKGVRYPVRWADGTLGSVRDTEQDAYPTAASRANPGPKKRWYAGLMHADDDTVFGEPFETVHDLPAGSSWGSYSNVLGPFDSRLLAHKAAKLATTYKGGHARRFNPKPAALPFYGDAEQKADAHRGVEAAYRRLQASGQSTSVVGGGIHSGEMQGLLAHSVAAKAWEEAARQLSRVRSGSWGVTEASARKAVRAAEKATASAEAADERYRAGRAESDRIRAKFAPRSNPVRWMVIIPNQHGEERMFGPYPSEGKARERLRDLESKGREPDGRGGFHTFRYGTGRLKALR